MKVTNYIITDYDKKYYVRNVNDEIPCCPTAVLTEERDKAKVYSTMEEAIKVLQECCIDNSFYIIEIESGEEEDVPNYVKDLRKEINRLDKDDDAICDRFIGHIAILWTVLIICIAIGGFCVWGINTRIADVKDQYWDLNDIIHNMKYENDRSDYDYSLDMSDINERLDNHADRICDIYDYLFEKFPEDWD